MRALLVSLIVVAMAGLSAVAPAAGADARGTVDVRFSGDSILHGFEGGAHKLPYLATATAAAGAEAS